MTVRTIFYFGHNGIVEVKKNPTNPQALPKFAGDFTRLARESGGLASDPPDSRLKPIGSAPDSAES